MKKFNIKTILFSTDFSEAADNALPFAVNLAKRSKAKLIFVHVVEAPIPASAEAYTGSVYLMQTRINAAKEILTEITTRISAQEKIETEYHVMQGFYYESMIRALHLYTADIIVMGTGGATGITEALFGTHAMRIVHNSPIPVLTIHQGIKMRDVTEIVFPVNEDKVTMQKADEVSYLAAIFNARISLYGIVSDFYMATKVEENLLILGTLFSNRKLKSTVKIIKGQKYEDEILKLCNNNKPALVAIASHKEHSILAVFHQNRDKKLVAQAMAPVLSVPVAE